MSAGAPCSLAQCPTCSEPFSTEEELCPVAMSCGHTVCSPCFGAMTSLTSPSCLLCESEVASVAIPSHLLSQADVEGVSTAASRLKAATLSPDTSRPTPACMNHGDRPATHFCCVHGNLFCESCTTDGCGRCACELSSVSAAASTSSTPWRAPLLEAADACRAGASKLLSAMSSAVDAEAALQANADSTLASFSDSIDALVAMLLAVKRAQVQKVQGIVTERKKALTMKAEVFAVSAQQLTAAATAATEQSSSASPDALTTLRLVRNVQQLASLNTTLDIQTTIRLIVDETAVAAAIDGMTRLVCLGPSPAHSTLVGPGVFSYHTGRVPNWFELSCIDTEGASVIDVEPSEVNLTFECPSTGAALAITSTIHLMAAGKFKCEYVCTSAPAQVARLFVHVRGKLLVTVAAVALVEGTEARGELVRTYTISEPKGNIGLVISPDGTRMLVSNESTSRISAYSTIDGSLLFDIGGFGVAPGKYGCPARMCVTPRDTILVAEYSNKRIQV